MSKTLCSSGLIGNIGFDEEYEAVYTVVTSPTRNILLISLTPT